MKVLLINKISTGGGAAVAANRLHRSLRSYGVDSKLLVQDLVYPQEEVYAFDTGAFSKQKALSRFVRERLYFLPYEKNHSVRFGFSPANTGVDISNHPLVQEADVIHIHWINQGFLSLETIKKLFDTGKPIVWTMHDMWAFTGGCHYAGSCLEFLESCCHCPFLRKPGKNDLSAQLFSKKRRIYSVNKLSIVACSKWLRTLAQESKLLRNQTFYNIPNSIDTNYYKRIDKKIAREKMGLPLDKKLVLFGVANVADPRKGIRYLIEALNILEESYPNVKGNTELLIFGKMDNAMLRSIPFKHVSIGYVKDPDVLFNLYNAADIYVLPSLQDNLPNTVMESMACETPVVGFGIGGVPEMISHQESGFLAEVKNAMSLANEIYNALFVSDLPKIGKVARQKVLDNYAEDIVAKQYLEVYEKALKDNQ